MDTEPIWIGEHATTEINNTLGCFFSHMFICSHIGGCHYQSRNYFIDSELASNSRTMNSINFICLMLGKYCFFFSDSKNVSLAQSILTFLGYRLNESVRVEKYLKWYLK